MSRRLTHRLGWRQGSGNIKHRRGLRGVKTRNSERLQPKLEDPELRAQISAPLPDDGGVLT
jgi:hypothetical protein